MLRGRDVSRIEGFSDAVFGFALTLLVVSLEVPDDFSDLRLIIIGFPAFAVTFTVICWVWYEHFLFFRRYDLEDGFTVLLNCSLLFIVVFYSYPLKFMFTRLVTGSLMGMGAGVDEGMTQTDARMLMVVYSSGSLGVFGIFALLYWHAWRQRLALALDALAIYDARASMRRHLLTVGVSVISIAIAVILPIDFLWLAGVIFGMLGPVHGTYGYVNGRRRERLEASLCPPSGSPPLVTRSAGASTV